MRRLLRAKLDAVKSNFIREMIYSLPEISDVTRSTVAGVRSVFLSSQLESETWWVQICFCISCPASSAVNVAASAILKWPVGDCLCVAVGTGNPWNSQVWCRPESCCCWSGPGPSVIEVVSYVIMLLFVLY